MTTQHDFLRALASVNGRASTRVQRCVTHHGCDCREWANDTLLQFRDAARSLLPVDEWSIEDLPDAGKTFRG